MNVILYGASDLSIEENYSIVDAFRTLVDVVLPEARGVRVE
jgi:hypothetical protein